jgi:hypothetical protein
MDRSIDCRNCGRIFDIHGFLKGFKDQFPVLCVGCKGLMKPYSWISCIFCFRLLVMPFEELIDFTCLICTPRMQKEYEARIEAKKLKQDYREAETLVDWFSK